MKKLIRLPHRGEKGLTLIELLIVVAILGILAAIIVPNLIGFIGTGKVAAANTEVANIESAVLAYFADHDGTFPLDSNVLYNADADSSLSYLSGPAQYALYGFDLFGKVSTVDPSLEATGIAWDGTKHAWVKE